jgi:CRISPR-associated endonuclease Cas2
MRQRKKHSAIIFVLKSMIPYSQENIMLGFKPNQFFNELEKSSGHKQATLKNAYWRAQQQGYIDSSGRQPKLSAKGLEEVKPFLAKHLGKQARLLVIFDVPEDKRAARNQLRAQLSYWEFEQIQKSVWATDMDYKLLLVETVSDLQLGGCVEIYESVRLFPET